MRSKLEIEIDLSIDDFFNDLNKSTYELFKLHLELNELIDHVAGHYSELRDLQTRVYGWEDILSRIRKRMMTSMRSDIVQ